MHIFSNISASSGPSYTLTNIVSKPDLKSFLSLSEFNTSPLVTNSTLAFGKFDFASKIKL